MTLFLKPLQLIFAHRRMLLATTWNDLRAKFAGSVLGMAWLVIYPLLLLATYAVVNIFILKVRVGAQFTSPLEYILLIFCGLIPFIGFSESLSNGVSAVTGNASLIKNTLFPIDLIPVKTVLTSQGTQVVGMALLLVSLACLQKLSFATLLLPAIWAAQILFTIGLIWILSSVNVFMRDLQSMINVVNMILMMISPIAYTEEMIPNELRPYLRLNPLYYLIRSYQCVLMLGEVPPMSVLATLFGMAVLMFFTGYLFFRQMKKVFVDNV